MNGVEIIRARIKLSSPTSLFLASYVHGPLRPSSKGGNGNCDLVGTSDPTMSSLSALILSGINRRKVNPLVPLGRALIVNGSEL